MNFKYIFSNILTATALLCTLAACSEDFDGDYSKYIPSAEEKGLYVGSLSKFQAEGESHVLWINASNTMWQITETPTWLHFTQKEGKGDDNIVITAQQNKNAFTRSHIFFVESAEPNWTYSTQVYASQYAAAPYIKAYDTNGNELSTKDHITCSAAEQTITLRVNSNSEWSYYEYESWIDVIETKTADENGYIKFKLDANTSTSRDGYIHLSCSNTSFYIYIDQSSPNIKYDKGTLNFTPAASSAKLTISSEDVTWTAATDTSWIDVTPTTGKGNTTMTVSVTANTSIYDRSEYVRIYVSYKSFGSITVKQEGLKLYTDSTTYRFTRSSAGCTHKIHIDANTDWEVESQPDWLSLSKSSGASGEHSITITSTENSSSTARSGKITFKAKGSTTVLRTVTVFQPGRALVLDENTHTFTDKAGSHTMNIQSDGAWTAVTECPWITLSQTSGTGDTKITISVTENKDYTDRTGTVTFYFGGTTKTLTVFQQGKYFDMTNQTINLSAINGKAELTISTNDTYTATVADNASWLTLTSDNSKKEPVITITASDNNTTSARTATIEIKSNGGKVIALTVKQPARTLWVDQSEVTFFAKGGTVTLDVKADGNFQVSGSGSWFAYTTDGNTITITAVQNTSEDALTGTLTISLTGIVGGDIEVTIPVKQYSPGSTLDKGDFSNDYDWNPTDNSGNGAIIIKAFGEDEQWDKASEQSDNNNIGTTGFDSDKKWD